MLAGQTGCVGCRGPVAKARRPDDSFATRSRHRLTGNAWEIARIIEPHVAQVLVVSPRAGARCDAREGARRAYTMRYTLPMAKTVPVRELRTNLSSLLSDVADRRDHVLVTRNGKPAAALVPIDEYDALEETAEILSDSETLAAIDAGLAELSRGEVVTLADLRAELDERRSTR